jgi:hypothetical protein
MLVLLQGYSRGRYAYLAVPQRLVVPGTQHIDPLGWQPLIMKFCDFFGAGPRVHPSRLARAWEITGPASAR